MPALQKKSTQMLCRGVNLATDLDNLPDGDFAYLNNIHSLTDGIVEARPGQVPYSITGVNPIVGSSIHTLFRLNDPLDGTALLFEGAGTGLYATNARIPGPVTQVGNGYSSNPMTYCKFRPDQSPLPYVYVADYFKMAKYDTLGNESPVGIVPPSQAPDAYLASGLSTSISDFTDTGWGAGGVANNLSVAQGYRTNTTVAAVTNPYLNVHTGFGFWCISPAATDEWMQQGVRVFVNGVVTSILEAHNAITATTIAAIEVDQFGVTEIILSTPVYGITRNAFLLLNSGGGTAEYFRVNEIIYNSQGTFSLRGITQLTHAAGESVTGVNSFDCELPYGSTVVFGNTIRSQYISVNCTGAGVGQLYHGATLNLSSIGDRAIQPDDYIHVSIKVDNPAAVVSGAVLFDVSNLDFNQDYYQLNFQANALQGSISSPGSTTPIASAELSITNALIAAAVPSVTSADTYAQGDQNLSQLGLMGTNGEWSELFLRVGSLQRIGTNYTQTLNDVVAISIQITVSAACNVFVNSWDVEGTFGPDVPPGTPTGINYRYRYRNSKTGARSIQSPGMRYGLFPKRQEIAVNCPNAVISSAYDYVDFERLDPNLQDASGTPQWHYVGSVVSTPAGIPTFYDTLTPSGIAVNQALETNVIQPFPILRPPITGTCSTVGTIVTMDSVLIPAQMLPDTEVTINGIAYLTRGFLSSGSVMFELETPAGINPSGTQLIIGSPVTFGNPLPVIFGPLSGNTALTTFALGDGYNPGTLYWFNGNDMDSADTINTLEITDPSEPLIGGRVWNQTVFVFTLEKAFIVTPAVQGSGNQFSVTQIPAGSGPISAWCIDSGLDGVYYVGRDGIYQCNSYRGATMVSRDLWPLFPHEGVYTTDTIALGNMLPIYTQVVTATRLFICDNDIYLSYRDLSGNTLALKSSTISKASLWRDATSAGWFPYSYAHPVTVFYLDEPDYQTHPVDGTNLTPSMLFGCLDGKVRIAGGTTDDGTAITCQVNTGYSNADNVRGLKLYVDCSTELIGSASLTVRGNYNMSALAGPVTITSSGRGIDPTSIDLTTAQNLALYTNINFQWTFSPGTQLFSVDYTYYDQPDARTNLVTQFLDHGVPGWKIEKYVRPELIGTGPVTLTITTDQGFVWTDMIYPGAKLQSLDTYVPALVKGKLISYSLNSVYPFVCFGMWARFKRWGGDRFVELDVFSEQVPR